MASKLTLRELYTLHREDVDSQHDRIRSLVRDLVARPEMAERSETERAFHALIQYLKLHFADEEQFMTAWGYREFSAHEAEHRHLIKEIHEADRLFLSCEMDLPSILPTLRARLEDHTTHLDRAYIDFCLQNLDSPPT